MQNWLVVSVESRKGGVGKTTAALNLARLLRQREYAVLFLDVDITGTNAVDALDSPFWRDITHILRPAGKDNHARANLLQLFQASFMAGEGAPKFASGVEARRPALVIDQDRINVLGSQIYALNGSSPNTDARIICKPSILFDELHAFWFIEFLQGTCEAFVESIASTSPGRSIAVVIDNSPGYMGIAPAVQEWLTDLGPRRGKFLTVSSLDKQDLVSCGHAVHSLHALFTRKWNASRKFTKANQGKPLTLEQDEQAFFLRLAEGQESTRLSRGDDGNTNWLSGSDLAFYRAAGDEFPKSPASYQGLVINRVPPLVKHGTYRYDRDEVHALLHRSQTDVVRSLLGDERSDYHQWMVTYDEHIEYQFIQSLISRKDHRRSHRQHYVEEIMERLMKRRPIPSDEPVREILRAGRELTPSAFDNLRQYVRSLHDIALNCIRLLDQQGFTHLARLIQDEWLPGNCLQQFRTAMRDVLLDTDFPLFEFVPWEDDSGPANPEAMELVRRLPRIINRNIEDMPVPPKLIEQFVPSISAIVGLSLNSPVWHSPLIKEFGELFAAIATTEAMHWAKRGASGKTEISIQRFLAGDSLNKDEIGKIHFKFHLHLRWIEEGFISRLYNTCASAQARLIDLRYDTEFLIQLMRRLIQEEMREPKVMPYIRGVAENVIVKKAVSHEGGLRQMAKGFSSAQYMEEFSAVLERILSRWESEV